MRTLKLMMLGIVVAATLQGASPVHAIENVRGKSYELTTRHGPWMIMVTSFRDVRDESQKKDGLTAEQAASELVFELRDKGIPAYTFSQGAVKGEIDTHDRLGRDDRRIYAAQRDMICVLAGNYGSIEDKIGQTTLNGIKKLHPRFLKDTKSGAILRSDASQRGPLAGAFMTINPLIDPKDVVQRTIDKETKALNTGIQYPLVKNPHKYTLRVATFSGKSAMPLGNSMFRQKESIFDKTLQESFNTSLNRAGEDANQLATFLRTTKAGLAANSGIDEAYVYHDKFQSIVTIGGFDSPDDPRIRAIAQYYGPTLIPDSRVLSTTRRTREELQAVTEDEIANLPKILTTHTEQLYPKNATADTRPLQAWTFDLEPKVIPVPRLK